MGSYRMAAVGEADSIIGFLALGVEIHPVTSTGEAAEILDKLVNGKERYGIVLITETVAEQIMDRIIDLSERDRKSTRLNSSHVRISYAVFCLKKKKKTKQTIKHTT